MKNPKFRDIVLWAILLMFSSIVIAGMFRDMNLGWMTFSSWTIAFITAFYLFLEWVCGNLYQE
jgi:hypothetical protein